MIQAILRGLPGLARFSGREPARQFWPYAAFVLFLAFAGAAAITLPQMIVVLDRMQKFAEAHPDQAQVQSNAAGYSITIEGNHPELFPDLSGVVSGMELTVALVVVLLASAVTRRLHDGGRTGLWGLLPLPFLAYGMIGMQKIFAGLTKGAGPDVGQFLLLFGNNMAYIASLALLVWLLMAKSDTSANRFGLPPQ